jgi:hypothetical protein
MMSRPKIALAKGARWLGCSLAGLGLGLLLFTAAAPLGFVKPYPAPPHAAVDGELGLSRAISDVRSLYRNPGEVLPVYLDRLTRSVAAGMVHYWTIGGSWSPPDARFTGISIFDNYLLWVYRLLPAYRANFQDYEFLTPDKAVARGYGFCSQVSKLVYSILHDQGIASTIVNNAQHTIVEADGAILDADYGVFVPHSIDWVQQHPDAVDHYYAAFAASLPLLRQAYAQPWQTLGSDAAFAEVRAYETRFERLKWIPPIVAIVAGLLLFLIASLVAKGSVSRRRSGPTQSCEPRSGSALHV